MSAPPGEQEAVDQLERLVRILDELRSPGGSITREPAGALHRFDVVARGSSTACWSHTLQRARSSAVQMPITGRLMLHTIGSTRAAARRTVPRGHPRPDPERRAMSEPNTQLETVNVHLADGVATVELNRPEALNAWNAQFGADLLAALRERRRGRRGACGRHHRRRARLLLGRRPEGHQRRRATAADGRPDVYKTLTERYHPIMHAIREMPKPVVASVNGAGRRHRLLAGALLRSDRGGRERLLPARVREHRAGPRRRLLAVRAHARRHGARDRAGDARRAPAGAAGARVGPDQPRRRPTRGSARRRRRWPHGWRPDRRAPTPAPSASSTTGCTRAWTSSSSSRRASSRRWPGSDDFVEGAMAFVEKRPARFSGS